MIAGQRTLTFVRLYVWPKTAYTFDTKIKVEKYFIDGYEYEGTVSTISHNTDLIVRMNSDRESNLR